MTLHYKVVEGESIQYVDVMSLYQFVCKYFKFSVGHTVLHVGDACRDMETKLQKEGPVKCCTLPPRTLYPPVRSFRFNSKLLFCLCKTCAIEQNTVCTHETIADRALIGSWVIDEIRRAVEKGYCLIEVFEVYKYEVTQYDPATGRGGLFVECINNFLKLKAEASGYPSWDRTPEDEDSYINMFKRAKASY
jgi:hypothetical protein